MLIRNFCFVVVAIFHIMVLFSFCVAVQIFNFHLISCMQPKQNSFQFLDRENFLFYRNYYWPPLDIIKHHMISYQNKLKNEYSSKQTRWFYLMFKYYYIHLYNKREKNGFVYILKVTTRAYELQTMRNNSINNKCLKIIFNPFINNFRERLT